MQIVIDIPSVDKAIIDKFSTIPTQVIDEIINAVRHGVTLPEHHGRLIDGDVIYEKLKTRQGEYQSEFLEEGSIGHDLSMCGRMFGVTEAKEMIFSAPTVLEGSE